MKNTIITSIVLGAFLAVSIPASADEKEGKIAQRKENQQQRIAKGVKSGQLTAGETSHLEKRESNLNKEIRTDRKADGGKLTAGEKKQVNHQQNKISRSIYKDKHNGAVQQQ